MRLQKNKIQRNIKGKFEIFMIPPPRKNYCSYLVYILIDLFHILYTLACAHTHTQTHTRGRGGKESGRGRWKERDFLKIEMSFTPYIIASQNMVLEPHVS